MLVRLLSLLVPPACVACRAPARAGDALCSACRRALPWLDPVRCPRCGLPDCPARAGDPAAPRAARPAGGRAGGHRRCPAAAAPWERAWAPVAYDGPARQLVAALKFRGALPVAGLMAAQIAAGAPPGLLTPGAALVPVPTHPVRARRRGFDQAQRLALALGGRTGLPVRPCLTRAGPASRQLGAGRHERLAHGRIAVSAREPAPARAVLVDDVHTTGATLAACAVALRFAGAAHVDAVAYARTLT
jgi:predicted amidophosphoribosyltransferase